MDGQHKHQFESQSEGACSVCHHKSFHSPWCWEKPVPKFEKNEQNKNE